MFILNFSLLIGLQLVSTGKTFSTCEPYPIEKRFNCWPFSGIVTYEQCSSRQCCFDNTSTTYKDVPQCFYQAGIQLYTVKTLHKSGTSYYATLELQSPSGWPKDVKHLAIDVTMETETRLHFKISDPYAQRYEVPLKVASGRPSLNEADVDYDIDIPSDGPFYITVVRKSNKQVLLNTRDAAPLIFADQYLQIGTYLNTQYVYGLGEHVDRFLLSTHWRRKVLWARDNGYVGPGMFTPNIYGSHPFYLNIDRDYKAHGVFLLNSNAMEIELQPAPAVTYRTTGGVLDFYVFTGPSPDNVIEQYTELIGRPFLPPYWALGFHLSRYGYNGVHNLMKVINRTRAAGMPYDSQWTDIDAMRAHLDWTYDSEGRWKGLDKVVKDLHDHGQHYNILVDPFISINQTKGTYGPYTEGLKDDIFVKNPDGVTNLVGKDWPGPCVWVDFGHPNATSYWTKSAQRFHDIIPFDSLLIKFVWVKKLTGLLPQGVMLPGKVLEEKDRRLLVLVIMLKKVGSEEDNSVDGARSEEPNIDFAKDFDDALDLISNSLKAGTLCPSAKQYLSTHYNLHSLYGHSEAIVSKLAVDAVRGKRSIVITRSTFSGTGVYAGHWSGDITSTWEQMNSTVTGLLSFQLFGLPFWGADICGFGGNTTAELCARWFQLGAFYPFMINHNSYYSNDQDPAVFDEITQSIIRRALELRYTLLPYLYTLLFRAHIDGTPVVRPLFFQYPESKFHISFKINEQFMWGSSLLVTPALQQGVTEGPAYLPEDGWYDFYTGQYVQSPGLYTLFSMEYERINLQIRAGSIIPTQDPAITTKLSRKNKFGLIAALTDASEANGELFWDDGDALDSVSSKKYNLIQFSCSPSVLESSIVQLGYIDEPMVLGNITVMGVGYEPVYVTINGEMHQFQYIDKVLYVKDLNVNLHKPFQLIWEGPAVS